jgi:hypothetical protein
MQAGPARPSRSRHRPRRWRRGAAPAAGGDQAHEPVDEGQHGHQTQRRAGPVEAGGRTVARLRQQHRPEDQQERRGRRRDPEDGAPPESVRAGRRRSAGRRRRRARSRRSGPERDAAFAPVGERRPDQRRGGSPDQRQGGRRVRVATVRPINTRAAISWAALVANAAPSEALPDRPESRLRRGFPRAPRPRLNECPSSRSRSPATPARHPGAAVHRNWP